jgi:hypothetical protein
LNGPSGQGSFAISAAGHFVEARLAGADEGELGGDEEGIRQHENDDGDQPKSGRGRL